MTPADEREEAIRAHLPLVKKIARRIHRLVPGADFGDLVGDGSIGLIRAVDNYDPERGPSLEQYARHVISGSILNGIRRMDPVSERARRVIRDAESERYRLATQRGELPDMRELAAVRPGLERAALMAYRNAPLSLDAALPEGESLACDWSLDPASIAEEEERKAQLRALVDALPPRQRHIVRHHYFAHHSLRDIGKAMAISPQRASQLHIAAISRLRKAYRATAN